MPWGKLLQPDLILDGTILELSPALLVEHQLKGLVLDVDETLVPLRTSELSAELVPWVQQIRPHADLWLVSNNVSETRIRRIAEELRVPYLSGAAKPSRRKLRRAVAAMGLPVTQVAMVGDRLFTDVLAGNRLGMFTILVEPMTAPNAEKRSPMHAFEFWLSEVLGASLISDRKS